jgi:hypothetical protein
LIGILILILIIAFFMRDRLKIMWFQMRSKFKKEPPSQPTPPSRPGPVPMRPGMGGPMRPMPMRRPLSPAPTRPYPAARQPLPRPGQDKSMDATFKKLREMSGKP